MRGHCLINGHWLQAGGDQFESFNPASAEVIWSGQAATAEDVNHAVMSAKSAFKPWRTLSPSRT